MRLLLTLVLPLLTLGAINRLEPRQLQGISEALRGSMSKQKAMRIESIEAKSKVPGAKRIHIIYGPYTIKGTKSTTKLGNGLSMDRGGTSYMSMVDDDFPGDITVLQSSSEIQTKDFRRATAVDQIYNHHNVFIQLNKNASSVYGCTDKSRESKTAMVGASVFTAGASEVGQFNYYAELNGKLRSSYYLKKDRRLLNMIDIVNYAEQDQIVYSSTEVEYLEGKPEGFVDAILHDLEPGMCGGPNGNAIHPPKGMNQFNVVARGMEVLHNGYIVNMRAHMHDGGVDIKMKISGRRACVSKALYGGPGHTSQRPDGKKWELLRETTDCGAIKVKKGDQIVYQANYDLDLHPSRPQGGDRAHGDMGGRKRVMDALDGDDAKQMAKMVGFFAIVE